MRPVCRQGAIKPSGLRYDAMRHSALTEPIDFFSFIQTRTRAYLSAEHRVQNKRQLPMVQEVGAV